MSNTDLISIALFITMLFWAFNMMYKFNRKNREPVREIRCSIISKREERVEMNDNKITIYWITIDNGFKFIEYRASGKILFTNYFKLKLEQRGTAYIRGNNLWKFVNEE